MRAIRTGIALTVAVALARSAMLIAQDSTASGAKPYFEFQVTKPVTQKQGSSYPRYPDLLKQAAVQGTVLAQFVVDTTGHAELASLRILKSDHELFSKSVRDALASMEFTPAEVVPGRKVRQLVQQPFVFAIATDQVPASAPPVQNRQDLSPASRGGTRSPTSPTGTSPGWTITMSMTMDSGGGRAPNTIRMKLTGSGKRVRQEISGAGMPPVATIMDTADSTITVVMAQMGMAMITKLPSLKGIAPQGTYTNVKTTRTDIGPGEAINGGPTTRHRIALSSTLTRTFNGVTCSKVDAQELEVWLSSDPVLPKVMTEFTASMPTLNTGTEDPREMLRLAGLDASKQSVVRTVVRDVGGSPGKPGITMTVEFSDYAILDVDAALLNAPAGLQVQDMRSMDMSAMMGGGMAQQMMERMFWSNFDTTAAAGASRASCVRK